MIGQTVSHYRIVEQLGGGGMGVVYKAEDTKLKRTVALKFLPPELTRHPEAKERFVREAQAASALDHPNICGIHDIGESDDGQLFIVMTCYEGDTLREKIERGPLSYDEAVAIAIQVAKGLEAAHEAGMVHRDIKPANVIVTTKGEAKILDFGIAKLAGQTMLTQPGLIVGTMAYMSPEQARGEQVDGRSDIWSLGVVLYEMVTGGRPFKSEYQEAVVYFILSEEPEPISGVRPDVPPALESVVRKATRKDAGGRYQHVTDMLVDLESLGEQLKPEASRKRASVERAQPSIAVLPFANLSADPENEYFSDGMSEEIINALTKLNGLHVVARTSAFAFKGKNEDIREIGKKLHVEHVLEGSVRKAGNRLRITAQLIKVADGYHLWSERFDRAMDDVFAIQDEISLAIVDKLKITLLEDEKDALAKRATENLPAYNLFLQGRYALNKNTRESLQHAIERFQEAIALSPDYAEAYAQTASAYYLLGLYRHLPHRDAYPKASAFAQKAIEIDPTSAEAHAVLATVKLNHDWDWEGAASAFRRAIQLNPKNARVRAQYAFYHLCRGRMNEALAEYAAAYSLDPLYDPANMGFTLLRMGRLEEARDRFQKSLESEPERAFALWFLGHVDVLQGRYEEGLSEIRRALSLSGNNEVILAGLGWSNAVAGNRDEAMSAIEELGERSRREYISPYYSAKIYSALGENDLAFEWLERAYEEHDNSLIAVLNDESLSGLHQDPRFDDLLKKMKLT
jgi:serine/threonine protein kinase/Tfp pilus assembly protein PilF